MLVITKSDLNTTQSRLMTVMSDISERCYYAGWMQHLEYHLWYAVLNGPIRYGQDNITQSDIDILKDLATSCQSWIVFEEHEIAIGLDQWKKLYEMALLNHTDIVSWL